MSFVSMSNLTISAGALTPQRRPPSIKTQGKTESMALGIFASRKSSSNGFAPSSISGSTSADNIRIEFDPADMGDMEFTPIMVSNNQRKTNESPTSDFDQSSHMQNVNSTGELTTELEPNQEAYLLKTSELLNAPDMFAVEHATSHAGQLDDSDSSDAALDNTPNRRDSVSSSLSSAAALDGTPSRRDSMNSSLSSLQGTPLLSSTPSTLGTLSLSPSREILSPVPELLQEETTLRPRRLDFSREFSPQTAKPFSQIMHSQRSFEGTLPTPKVAPVEYWRSQSSSHSSSPLRIPSYCKTVTHSLSPSQRPLAIVLELLKKKSISIPKALEESSLTSPSLCIHWDEESLLSQHEASLFAMSQPSHQTKSSDDVELWARLNKITKERQNYIKAINRLDRTESQNPDVINYERQTLLRKYRAESISGKIEPSARYKIALSYQLGHLRDVRAEFDRLRMEDLKGYLLTGSGKTQSARINEIWRHYDEVTRPFEGRIVHIDIATEMQAKREKEEEEKEAQAEIVEFYSYRGIDIRKQAQRVFAVQTEKVIQVNTFYEQASRLEKEIQPLEKKLHLLTNSIKERAKLSKDLTKQLKPLKAQLKNLKTQIQKGHLIVQPVHLHFIILKKELRDRHLDLINLAEHSKDLVKGLDSRIEILRQQIAKQK